MSDFLIFFGLQDMRCGIKLKALISETDSQPGGSGQSFLTERGDSKTCASLDLMLGG